MAHDWLKTASRFPDAHRLIRAGARQQIVDLVEGQSLNAAGVAARFAQQLPRLAVPEMDFTGRPARRQDAAIGRECRAGQTLGVAAKRGRTSLAKALSFEETPG